MCENKNHKFKTIQKTTTATERDRKQPKTSKEKKYRYQVRHNLRPMTNSVLRCIFKQLANLSILKMHDIAESIRGPR